MIIKMSDRYKVTFKSGGKIFTTSSPVLFSDDYTGILTGNQEATRVNSTEVKSIEKLVDPHCAFCGSYDTSSRRLFEGVEDIHICSDCVQELQQRHVRLEKEV